MKTKSKKEIKLTAKHKDLPVSIGLVHSVRDELKADIRALDHKMDAGFKAVEARLDRNEGRFNSIEGRFNSIEGRFNSIEAQFKNVDARFREMEARFDRQDEKIERVLSSVHRIEALVEEQNSRNQLVIEAVVGMNERMNRLETRQDSLEDIVHHLARRSTINEPRDT